jgi:hypothetical protein
MPSPPDDGVPLSHYLAHGDLYGLRFECLACQESFDVPLSEVVAKLKSQGLGDENTGVKAVGRLSTRPCGRCGAVRWMTRPAHHPRPPRE